MSEHPSERGTMPEITIERVDTISALPASLSKQGLAEFLHRCLRPYEDPLEQILAGIEYALSDDPCRGGFVLLAKSGEALLGALVCLETGMTGYVPENILLFVAVDPSTRGQGVGGRLVRRCVEECRGDVKLHVEHENPARRLYERCGFASKYLEMRWTREPHHD